MAKKIVRGLGIASVAMLCLTLIVILIDSEPDQCKRAGLWGIFMGGPAGILLGPMLRIRCEHER